MLGSYRNYHLSLQEDQDHTAFGPTSSPMVIQQIQYRDEGLNNFYGELLWKSPEDQRLTWMAGVDYFNETFTFQRIFSGSVDFNLLNQSAFGSPGYTYGNLLCSFLMLGNPGTGPGQDPNGGYAGGCEATPAGPGNPGAPGLPGAASGGSFPYNFPNIGVQSGANAFGGPGQWDRHEVDVGFCHFDLQNHRLSEHHGRSSLGSDAKAPQLFAGTGAGIWRNGAGIYVSRSTFRADFRSVHRRADGYLRQCRAQREHSVQDQRYG